MGKSPGASTAQVPTEKNREEKYLLFSLAGETYGLHILRVQEIIGLMPITAVPKMPSFYKGVINLRGRVIPVVDLRRKFDLPEGKYDSRSCIVIVQVETEGNMLTIGMIVDMVSEVMNIPGVEIEPPPVLGSGSEQNFIRGMAKSKDAVKILLDVDRIFTSKDVAAFEQTA